MSGRENNRETGARKYPAKTDADASDQVSQAAASNKRPAGGIGLTESVGDVNEITRHSDGQKPSMAAPGPVTEKHSGADLAIAEHSKDAKAPEVGRQPGAYVKD